jgi:hypothetical protein
MPTRNKAYYYSYCRCEAQRATRRPKSVCWVDECGGHEVHTRNAHSSVTAHGQGAGVRSGVWRKAPGVHTLSRNMHNPVPPRGGRGANYSNYNRALLRAYGLKCIVYRERARDLGLAGSSQRCESILSFGSVHRERACPCRPTLPARARAPTPRTPAPYKYRYRYRYCVTGLLVLQV